MLKLAFNTLGICGAAGFSGVMLCIGVTLGGYWRSLPAQEFLDWFAANNGYVARSVPVIVLPTLIGLVGSLWLSRGSDALLFWCLSAACFFAVLIRQRLSIVLWFISVSLPPNAAITWSRKDPASLFTAGE